jgi:hypothetical protein
MFSNYFMKQVHMHASIINTMFLKIKYLKFPVQLFFYITFLGLQDSHGFEGKNFRKNILYSYKTEVGFMTEFSRK